MAPAWASPETRRTFLDIVSASWDARSRTLDRVASHVVVASVKCQSGQPAVNAHCRCPLGFFLRQDVTTWESSRDDLSAADRPGRRWRDGDIAASPAQFGEETEMTKPLALVTGASAGI